MPPYSEILKLRNLVLRLDKINIVKNYYIRHLHYKTLAQIYNSLLQDFLKSNKQNINESQVIKLIKIKKENHVKRIL